jgi:hypothetical protein
VRNIHIDTRSANAARFTYPKKYSAAISQPDPVLVARSVHEHVDAQLANFDTPSYIVPSSGMIVIDWVLQ